MTLQRLGDCQRHHACKAKNTYMAGELAASARKHGRLYSATLAAGTHLSMQPLLWMYLYKLYARRQGLRTKPNTK